MLVDVVDPALSDAVRPQAPDLDDIAVSALGRRVGEHLVEVHNMFRRELDQVRDVLDQVRSGQLSAGGARGELQRIALLANNWTFGGICQQYCLQLTQHHELESGQISRTYAAPRPPSRRCSTSCTASTRSSTTSSGASTRRSSGWQPRPMT
jgi:hypothetical protein